MGYNAFLNATTGEIERMELERGINPEDGLQPDGTYLKYIDGDLGSQEPDQYMRTHVWLWETEAVGEPGTDEYVAGTPAAWLERDEPPNDYAVWSTLLREWTWDFDQFLALVRRERKALLAETDWTQAADAPLTSEQVTEAQTYRQALRDVTQQVIDNPEGFSTLQQIEWPAKPDFL